MDFGRWAVAAACLSAACVTNELPVETASQMGTISGRVAVAAPAPAPIEESAPEPQDQSGLLPETPFVPGDLLLKTTSDVSDEDLSEGAYEVSQVVPISSRWRLVRFRGLEGETPTGAETELLEQLVSRMPGVVAVELNWILQPAGLPDDPAYPLQWYLPALNLPGAWELTTGSAKAVVAVVDTGYTRHPELEGRLVPGWDFVSDPERAGDGDGRDDDATDPGGDLVDGGSSWHGTRVAALIGAKGDDRQGLVGVDWKVMLQPVRALGRGGGTLADVAAALEWASGGRVPGVADDPTPSLAVNLSLGALLGRCPTVLQDVIDGAVGREVLVVAAAGNGSAEASAFAPADCRGVLSVAAVDRDGHLAGYSNRGGVTLAAFGGDLAADLDGDGVRDGIVTAGWAGELPVWQLEQGTSYAAAEVTGIASLMRARNSRLAPQDLIGRLTQSSRGWLCAQCGAGLVDAAGALALAPLSVGERPSRIVAADVALGASLQGTLVVRNEGKVSAHVVLDPGGDPRVALDATEVDLGAQQSHAFAVVVNAQGLMPGTHRREIALSWGSGTASVGVGFQVLAPDADRQVQVVAFTRGESGYVECASTWVSLKSPEYQLLLPPGDYLIRASVDDDQDGVAFGKGDRVGGYPNADALQLVGIQAGGSQGDVDIAL